ncbi:MAG: phosphoserine transaminase [Acidimicrobiales bacterium]
MPALAVSEIRIPADLLPADGRFGCGPSKVRPSALAALAATGTSYMGTSHRQAPVRSMVGRLRAGMVSLFSLPDGYEVVLGNGGASLFWDLAAACLVERRSQHLVFGEFSSKFAAAVAGAPFLDAPEVISAPVGSHPAAVARDDIDLYALTHNETSTGVAMPVGRAEGAAPGSLVAVDATSGAGGLRVDISSVDAYYFSLQKGFASDGGLWVALLSPAAVDRAERVAGGPGTGRWVPASLDLRIAIGSSRKDETWNTPSLATLFLAVDQVEWLLGQGGLEWAASRCERSAEVLYGWADSSSYASPFVAKPAERSPVVATIDLDPSVDGGAVCAVLRANGIVDTDPYRKLGRNQLRVAMFPAIDPADVESLTKCVDWVVSAVSSA